MPASRGHPTGPGVRFDELAFAEDMSHASAAGRRVALDTRRRLELDGVDVGDLLRCQPEGRDGTRLERCVKLYLPSAGGPWRMVFEITRNLANGELVLAYLAFGLGHPASRGSRRRTKLRTGAFISTSSDPRASDPSRAPSGDCHGTRSKPRAGSAGAVPSRAAGQ
jgi:hypothetical protein